MATRSVDRDWEVGPDSSGTQGPHTGQGGCSMWSSQKSQRGPWSVSRRMQRHLALCPTVTSVPACSSRSSTPHLRTFQRLHPSWPPRIRPSSGAHTSLSRQALTEHSHVWGSVLKAGDPLMSGRPWAVPLLGRRRDKQGPSDSCILANRIER